LFKNAILKAEKKKISIHLFYVFKKIQINILTMVIGTYCFWFMIIQPFQIKTKQNELAITE